MCAMGVMLVGCNEEASISLNKPQRGQQTAQCLMQKNDAHSRVAKHKARHLELVRNGISLAISSSDHENKLKKLEYSNNSPKSCSRVAVEFSRRHYHTFGILFPYL